MFVISKEFFFILNFHILTIAKLLLMNPSSSFERKEIYIHQNLMNILASRGIPGK